MIGLTFLATPIYRSRLARTTATTLAILIGGVAQMGFVAAQETTTVKPEAANSAASDEHGANGALEKQVAELIEMLSSKRFAHREQASESLFQLGREALPLLETHRRLDDPEQNERLTRIIESLNQEDLKARIESFLRGEKPELDNWSEVERWFGDSPRVREMYVDLYREYPDVVHSLNGTRQQLLMALAEAQKRMLANGIGRNETPRRVDILALLLPMVRKDFKAGARYDLLLASSLQLYGSNDFRNDIAFGTPFRQMISLWMLESDLVIREQVLRLALQWKLDVALTLAIETLKQTPNPIVACRCMQAIASRGTREQSALVVPYLSNNTIVYRKQLLSSGSTEVQVGDVAAATIARLHDLPVTEIGFAEPAEDETFGFIYEQLVLPVKFPLAANKPSKDDPDSEKNQNDPKQPAPPRRPTLRELQQMAEQHLQQTEAARRQIRQRALKLSEQSPAKPPKQG